jgi:cytochrome b subunit of formate dehydrogenase
MTADHPAGPSDESVHPRTVFDASFDEATRKQLVEEDSAAWYAVTGLLLVIITGGVMIALLALAICSVTVI